VSYKKPKDALKENGIVDYLINRTNKEIYILDKKPAKTKIKALLNSVSPDYSVFIGSRKNEDYATIDQICKKSGKGIKVSELEEKINIDCRKINAKEIIRSTSDVSKMINCSYEISGGYTKKYIKKSIEKNNPDLVDELEELEVEDTNEED